MTHVIRNVIWPLFVGFKLKGSSHLTQKDIKTQFNRLSRIQSVEEIIELKNDDSRDWWTKYFASVESAIIEVRTQFWVI